MDLHATFFSFIIHYNGQLGRSGPMYRGGRTSWERYIVPQEFGLAEMRRIMRRLGHEGRMRFYFWTEIPSFRFFEIRDDKTAQLAGTSVLRRGDEYGHIVVEHPLAQPVAGAPTEPAGLVEVVPVELEVAAPPIVRRCSRCHQPGHYRPTCRRKRF